MSECVPQFKYRSEQSVLQYFETQMTISPDSLAISNTLPHAAGKSCLEVAFIDKKLN